MTPFDRHILAATGYLELGMPLDANESLEDIDAELRVLPQVLVVCDWKFTGRSKNGN